MSFSITEILEYRAAHAPDLIALQDVDGFITYSDWRHEAQRMAKMFALHDMAYRDMVALEGSRKGFIPSAVAYMAVELLGAIPLIVPENMSSSDKERAYRQCGLAHIVRIRDNGNTVILHRDRASDFSIPSFDDQRISEVLFSSGTTGIPKLIACPMDEITYMWDESEIDISERGIEVHGAAWGTNYSQEIMRSSLLWGSHIFTPRNIDGKGILESIREFGVNTLRLTPPLARALIRQMKQDTEGQVRHISISSAASDPGLLDSVQRHFPQATIINQYSATESGRSRLELVWGKDPRDVLGRPQDGTEVRINTGSHEITTDDGHKAGEIELRHHQAPSRRVLTGDKKTGSSEWVHTGDLGYLREDGYVVLVDRVDDIINCGGRKVSSLQLESAIRNIPNVSDVLVCGVPHPTLGEAIGVLLCKNNENEPVRIEDMFNGMPVQTIKTVDMIPLTRAGKPDRKQARTILTSSTASKHTGESDDISAHVYIILDGVIPNVEAKQSLSWVAAGGDSLASVELMDILSEEYGIELDPNLFDADHTIQDLIRFVQDHLNGAES